MKRKGLSSDRPLQPPSHFLLRDFSREGLIAQADPAYDVAASWRCTWSGKKNGIFGLASWVRERQTGTMKFPWPGALLVLASAACAQQPAQSAPKVATLPPAGIVTGHVTASDTQRPARFVEVVLLLKKQSDSDDDDEKPSALPELVTGRSGLDGSFTILNVPEGDYYIFGEMPGYLQPYKRLAKIDEDAGDDENMAKAMADVPVIHVTADRATTRDITIKRGAVMSGRVLYDDGSPAPNLRLSWEPVEGVDLSDSLTISMDMVSRQGNVSVTDDRGRFRIVGLEPGKYRLLVHVVAEDEFQWSPGGARVAETFSAQQMTVYAPGKFRRSEAQIVEVRGNEEVPDVEIRIALDETHTVSGRIVAKEDNHAPNHSSATLADPTGELPAREVRVNEQGQFHFSYVPSGTYELRIQGRDSVLGPDPRRAGQMTWQIAKDYQPVKLNVLVNDQDVKVDDVLVEAKKAHE
jgi:hypothetical protein